MCEHLIFLWPLIIFFAQFGEKNIEILCGHVAEHDRWLIHIWVRDALVVLRRLSAMAVVPDYLLKNLDCELRLHKKAICQLCTWLIRNK